MSAHPHDSRTAPDDLDPFAVEVIRHGLTAAAEEMSLVVMRSARSPLLRASAVRAVGHALHTTRDGWEALWPDGRPDDAPLWLAAALYQATLAELPVSGVGAARRRGRAFARQALREDYPRPALLGATLLFCGGRPDEVHDMLWRLSAEGSARGMAPVERFAATLLVHRMTAPKSAARKAWDAQLKQLVLRTQEHDDAESGHWTPQTSDERRLGRTGLAAVRTLTLELYYGYSRVVRVETRRDR